MACFSLITALLAGFGAPAYAAAETPNNLARTATVTQSSTNSGQEASRAIDGLTTGIAGESSVAETLLEAEAWWEADLGAVHDIPELKVWSRTDGCCDDTLVDWSVFISDVPFTSTSVAATRAQAGVTEFHFDGPVEYRQWMQPDRTGRYVRVQLNGTGTLSLAEVQVGGPFEELSNEVTRTWGVQGIGPSLNTDIQSQIFALEQVGNTIYVGGRFTEVIERRNAAEFDQPYLAAFDATTGVWIDWWRPELDGMVRALEASPDGSRLFVGGDFTSINGDPLASGLAALDPATGLIDPTWRADLSRVFAPATAVVNTLDTNNGFLYAGGNFSHATTPPTNNPVNLFNAGRFSLTNGQVDATWRPSVTGGGVLGISANDAGTRVYMVGVFEAVNGEPDSGNFFPADATTGALVPGLNPYPWNFFAGFHETFDVVAANDLVFVGGSQHLLSVLDESDLSIVNQVTMPVNVLGGDVQDIELAGDRVYATCHCRGTIFDGAGSVNSPDAIAYGAVTGSFALDAHTGEYVDTYPTAILEYTLSTGPWAAHSAPDGCLWLGGDMNLTATGDQFINSLVKHCPEAGEGPPAGPPLTQPAWDTQPPSVPGNVNASFTGPDEISLTWNSSTDNDAVGYYRIYRDGELIATSGYTSFEYHEGTPGTYDYTVTAVDVTLNESAPSPASTVIVPATPGAFDVYLTSNGFELSEDPFTYADDTFNGTDNPEFATGRWVPDGTFDGAGLVVRVGGVDPGRGTIFGISGAYESEFTLDEAGPATVSLVYRLEVGTGFDPDECADVLLAVDGSFYGQGGNDYLVRICNGGLAPYAPFEVDLGVLGAGTHTIQMGSYVNWKDWNRAGNNANAVFDDVVIVSSTPGAEITAPSDGAGVNGTQTISVAALDLEDAAGSLGVEVAIDGGAWQPASWNAAASRYELSWDSDGVAPGPHTIDARATDSDGYTTGAQSVTVSAGNEAPDASITAPLDGAIVSGTTTV
ncbi:MAG TPA: Ig-like domain-containing protein, partial [Acidimicrobiia bacterium]